MANYNNNERNKSGYFDQYVNFDQFLMQHNINNFSPLRSSQSGVGFTPTNSEAVNSNSSFHSYTASGSNNAFYFHSQSNASSDFGTQNWMPNSNLTATANEFIPQQATNTSTSSSLLATASEFIPKNLLMAPDKSFKEISNCENKQTDTVSGESRKNDRSTVNAIDFNTTKTESVIEALSNTHISDGDKTTANPLSSSGGAIKKVRSQDYRNDSRDRHSNGKFKI